MPIVSDKMAMPPPLLKHDTGVGLLFSPRAENFGLTARRDMREQGQHGQENER